MAQIIYVLRVISIELLRPINSPLGIAPGVGDALGKLVKGGKLDGISKADFDLLEEVNGLSANQKSQAYTEFVIRGGAANKILVKYSDGSFSVSDWTRYPSDVPRPPDGTTYRLLTGSEYEEARRLANNANAKLRRDGIVPEGHEIHEIIPVKYGGSPTDPANKVYLPRGVHRSEVTPWWNRLQRDLER